MFQPTLCVTRTAPWKVIYLLTREAWPNQADMRKRAGEISYQLLLYDDDVNKIVHFSEWASLDQARRFFESPELVEITRKVGANAPDFMYLQENRTWRAIALPHRLKVTLQE